MSATRRYQSAELINGRTAMTAVAGILIPSVLTHAGLIDLPAWYEAGKVNDAHNGWDFRALLFVQFVLSHFVEIKRFEDLKNPGSQVRAAPLPLPLRDAASHPFFRM